MKIKTKRAKKTGTLVGVRLQPDILADLDAYRTMQTPPCTRPEAIRNLLAEYLPINIANIGRPTKVGFHETEVPDFEKKSDISVELNAKIIELVEEYARNKGWVK